MKKNILIPEIINSVILAEKQALDKLFDVDKSVLISAINMVNSTQGKIIVTGIGKSGIVARKFVATLNSTGSTSLFLHAGDAMHGDVGVIDEKDIVVFISKSGGSKEIIELLTYVNSISVKTIGICNNPQSYLATNSTVNICIPNFEEADSDNIIPTSSIITHLAICDCIAISLQNLNSFTSEDFGKLHPRGTLGKQLRTVYSIAKQNSKPSVKPYDELQKVIYTISTHKLGACCVVNDTGSIEGIITDGDIRRMLENNSDVSGIVAGDIMTTNPKSINGGDLAKIALNVMSDHNINQLIVIDSVDSYLGMLHIQDLINE